MGKQSWHRRRAIQLAAQLPDRKDDALLVLQEALRLVVLPGFWEAPAADKLAPSVLLIAPRR